MNLNSKFYIAGHNGMVGSSLHRKLKSLGYNNFILADHNNLDLTNQKHTLDFFLRNKPDYVFLAAAKVGGIKANNEFRASFIYQNLMIQNNVIHSSYLSKVKKLLFLGSSCIYPKNSAQPIKENSLLSGPLENTNEPYAIAKIAGIKLCENYFREYESNFISVMPTNLYGPNDNFDLESSHVIPALLRKFIEAKNNEIPYVKVWGTGKPKREFLHVDDLADACVHLFKKVDAKKLYNDGLSHINVGSGNDIKISELAEQVKEIVGYSGDIIYDSNMPDGTMRKLLDTSYIRNLNWQPKIELKDGLKSTHDWYLKN